MAVTAGVGLVFGLIFAIFAAEKATKFVSFILRILNPP